MGTREADLPAAAADPNAAADPAETATTQTAAAQTANPAAQAADPAAQATKTTTADSTDPAAQTADPATQTADPAAQATKTTTAADPEGIRSREAVSVIRNEADAVKPVAGGLILEGEEATERTAAAKSTTTDPAADPANAAADPADATTDPADATTDPADATADPADATADPADATATDPANSAADSACDPATNTACDPAADTTCNPATDPANPTRGTTDATLGATGALAEIARSLTNRRKCRRDGPRRAEAAWPEPAGSLGRGFFGDHRDHRAQAQDRRRTRQEPEEDFEHGFPHQLEAVDLYRGGRSDDDGVLSDDGHFTMIPPGQRSVN